jgi:hypothetical protein
MAKLERQSLAAAARKARNIVFKECATLIATFQLLRGHIEAPHRHPQAVG